MGIIQSQKTLAARQSGARDFFQKQELVFPVDIHRFCLFHLEKAGVVADAVAGVAHDFEGDCVDRVVDLEHRGQVLTAGPAFDGVVVIEGAAIAPEELL